MRRQSGCRSWKHRPIALYSKQANKAAEVISNEQVPEIRLFLFERTSGDPCPHFLTLQSLAATTPDGTPSLLRSVLILPCRAHGDCRCQWLRQVHHLLRIMAGDLMPASGHVTRSGTVAMMQQAWPDRSIRGRQALGVAADLARLQRIEEGKGSDADLELADWLLPARLDAILDQIGLDASTLEGTLSTPLRWSDDPRCHPARIPA